MSAPRGLTVLEYFPAADGLPARCIAEAPCYGAINGYAEIPEGVADVLREGTLHVHGGVTYNHEGWAGFDTLHAGDRWPGDGHHPAPWDIWWTREKVIAETLVLAKQLVALAEFAPALRRAAKAEAEADALRESVRKHMEEVK